MELLLIFAPVLAGLLFTTLNDDDDVEPVTEPDPQPEPEPESDVVSGRVNDLGSEDNAVSIDDAEFYGLIHGGSGNDTINVTNSAGYGSEIDLESAGLSDAFWDHGELNTFYDFDNGSPGDDTSDYLYRPESYSEEYGHSEPVIYGDTRLTPEEFAAGDYPFRFMTEIQGGEGNDHITLADGYFYADGGQGTDTITLDRGAGGIIKASDGDSILVNSGYEGDAEISGYGAILFDASSAGSGASFDVDMGSDGASTLMGGAGQDNLRAYGEGAVVSGGDGDDEIGVNPNFYLGETAETYFGLHTSELSGTADGGKGNDTISFDYGDTVTGGEGNDTFTGYLAPGATAHVTDFEPGKDVATIWVETVLNDDPGIGIPENISVAEVDGNTEISQSGNVIARFEGVTGLIVARFSVNEENDNIEYVDQHGNPINSSSADIMIEEFVKYP